MTDVLDETCELNRGDNRSPELEIGVETDW